MVTVGITPQESFFGHLKDEISIKECETFEDLVKEIDEYIEYYNNFQRTMEFKKDDSCSIQKSSSKLVYSFLNCP